MVKIRLRRIGAKGQPFYRVVVANSTAARGGAFIETIGTYNPVAKPKHLAIDGDRALHWLLLGARPTETMAYLLNKTGVLEQYFAQRTNAKKDYGFLDKRTAATSVRSVVDKPAGEPKAKAEPAAAAPVAEAIPEPTPEPEAIAELEAPITAEPEAVASDETASPES